MADWAFTVLGRRFFDGQLPQLIRNLGRLADELKRYNDAQEATQAAQAALGPQGGASTPEAGSAAPAAPQGHHRG